MSEPLILCLETSAAYCSVAIRREAKNYVKFSKRINTHSEDLQDYISEVMEMSGIELRDLDAICVSNGPGSYTGLRIGSATALGLCFSLQIPLISVSTLFALALKASQLSKVDYYWPMIDARRMEVYSELYDKDLKVVQAVNNGIVTEPEFLAKVPTGKLMICGDGAVKCKELIEAEYLDIIPMAEYLCEPAIERFKCGLFEDLYNYEPFYLKPANITASSKK